MGCPSKVVLMMAKAPGASQKETKRQGPYITPAPSASKTWQRGHGMVGARGVRANSRCTGGRGERPSALPGSGQVGSPSGSPHSPVPPQPWCQRTPRHLRTALVPQDITVPPTAPAAPGTAVPLVSPASPLELVVPQDAAVGELDDGRVRDGFVGRHRGAAGAGEAANPPVTGARGRGPGVAKQGRAAATGRAAAAGLGSR